MTHHGMLWYVAYNQRYWPCAESDRGLVALPLFHKNALRGTVKPMLYAGGSFVLMPGYGPRAYLDALAKYKCTYSRGVAAVFTMFLQHRDYLRTLDLGAPSAVPTSAAAITTSRRSRAPNSPTDGCTPATSSARTRMASSTSAAASTTCSVAAGKTSIRRRSRICCSAILRWSMRWSRRCRIP